MAAEALILRFDEQEVEATCTVDTSGLAQIRLNNGEPLTVRPVTSGTYQVSRRSFLVGRGRRGWRPLLGIYKWPSRGYYCARKNGQTSSRGQGYKGRRAFACAYRADACNRYEAVCHRGANSKKRAAAYNARSDEDGIRHERPRRRHNSKDQLQGARGRSARDAAN